MMPAGSIRSSVLISLQAHFSQGQACVIGGAQVRIAVTVLNVISSLASLAMVWFGWVMAGFAAEFDPLHRDYYGIAYGVTLMGAFLIIPALCVATSTKHVRQDRRSSVLVSLAPVALIPPAILMYTAGGLRMLEHTIGSFFGHR
jgi:hypothetical protein